MLNENWATLLFVSYLLVALINSALASFTTIYYSKSSWGTLSHSQLRVKQKTATIEHRLNVFAQTFIFSFTNLKVYVATAIVWLLLNFFLVGG